VGLAARFAVWPARRATPLSSTTTLKDEAEAVARALPSAHVIKADVSKPSDITKLFRKIRRYGPLYALINNAGFAYQHCSGLDITLPKLRKTFAVNFVGAFLCTQLAANQMRRQGRGGVIINVSSYSVLTGGAFNHIDYAAAKAAVASMTRGFSRELKDFGIRVNAVVPGTIDTEFGGSLTPEKRKRAELNIPAGRLGAAEEVARVVCWLLSQSACAISGALIPVDGGRAATRDASM
jgi:NAD(P)-dependent dehydrogenase (short-subunit alcohol dehydrogenase family)